MSDELLPAIVGAVSGLAGVVIGSFSAPLVNLLNRKIENRGRISLHVKFVYSKGFGNPCGVENITNDVSVCVPLWLEICNTKGTVEFIRNLNISAYNDDQFIANFNQIQKSITNDVTYEYGNDETYSFVAQPHNISRYNIVYSLPKGKICGDQKDFNRLIISYYDTNNRLHCYKLLEVSEDSCWLHGAYPVPDTWIMLDSKNKVKTKET